MNTEYFIELSGAMNRPKWGSAEPNIYQKRSKWDSAETEPLPNRPKLDSVESEYSAISFKGSAEYSAEPLNINDAT